MKNKTFITVILAVTLLITLTACSTAKSPDVSDNADSTTQQTEKQSDTKNYVTEASTTHVEETSKPESTSTNTEKTTKTEVTASDTEKEPWKTAFEEDLFQKYGVIPEYYEDLGNGIYQVYVEVGGKVVPFVAVNSATGDYHG